MGLQQFLCSIQTSSLSPFISCFPLLRTMCRWFPYNTLISWVRSYRIPPLKTRSASTAKDFGIPVCQNGVLHGFRKQTRAPQLRAGRPGRRRCQRHAGRMGPHEVSQRRRTSEVRCVHTILRGHGFQRRTMSQEEEGHQVDGFALEPARSEPPVGTSPTNVNRTAPRVCAEISWHARQPRDDRGFLDSRPRSRSRAGSARE
jgi:hypothetical protein